MEKVLEQIIAIYEDASDKNLAKGMSAYMKDKFLFYGIKTPHRREICKPILQNCKTLSKKESIDLAKKLWNQPQRELHYFGQELLLQNLKKNLDQDDIVWMEWLVMTNSWWDTVDFVAPKLMSLYFKKFPHERKSKADQWIKSENIWLIRSAILFQLKYKKDTDLVLLFGIILSVNHTKEFFINKAIGWVLRENAKRIPEVIYDFIRTNQDRLSNLSVREGLKHSATEQL